MSKAKRTVIISGLIVIAAGLPMLIIGVITELRIFYQIDPALAYAAGAIMLGAFLCKWGENIIKRAEDLI